MRHWKMWGAGAVLTLVLALLQAGCASRYDDVSRSSATDSGTGDASPYTEYPGRPTFPPHTEAP